MIGVVIGSRKHNINPDNIATPIASSLGDMITVALLGCTSSFLFNKIQTEPWIAPLLMVINLTNDFWSNSNNIEILSFRCHS